MSDTKKPRSPRNNKPLEGEVQKPKKALATPIDCDDETQALVKRFMSIKESTDIDLPIYRGKLLTGQELEVKTSKKEAGLDKSYIEMGFYYLLLKRELGHGAFGGRLKDKGVEARTAQRWMKAALLVQGVSESNATRVSHLPQRTINLIAALPAPIVDEMFDDGTLNDDLTYGQTQEVVQLRKQLDKEYKKNDRLSERVGQLDEETRKNKALPETALYIKELRRAVLEETECLRVNSHTLQSIMDRAAMLPQDVSQAELDSVVHPLMYALQGLYATITALHDKGFDLFKDFKADVDVFPPELDKKEVANAKRLMKSFDNEAQLRDKLRQVDLAPTGKKVK